MILKDFYDEIKRKGHNYGGFYCTLGPIFVPIDFELTKRILQNDFEHFVDRDFFYDPKYPLSANLLSLKADAWRVLRKKLTPTFTSGKLKHMCPIILKIIDELTEVIDANIGESVDLNDLMKRFYLDVTSNCFFGLEGNSLRENDSDFAKYSDLLTHHTSLEILRILLTEGIYNPAKLTKIYYCNEEVQKYFINLVEETIKNRTEHNLKRQDFLDLLMEMVESEQLYKEESLREIISSIIPAQVLVYFLAGHETSSLTTSCCLFELCKQQHFQEKLRNKIQEEFEKNNKTIDIEWIQNLKYLDQTITGA